MGPENLARVRSIKRMKNGASRKQLLLVASTDDGPWCAVHFVKAVEVLGAEENTVIKIAVRNTGQQGAPVDYMHKGPGYKPVNIPHGEMKIIRIKGKEQLTVYAHCGS